MVPNFDTMTREELLDFGNEATNGRGPAVARKIFPHFPRKPGYVRVTKDLGHYAFNKAVAMGLRKVGNIEEARVYETIADRIYQELPAWAKW